MIEIQDDPDQQNNYLIYWISLIVLVAVIVLIVVFAFYFFSFNNPELSDDPEVWGQFGDFVGGTANPILGFLTLISLCLTIAVQNRQLRLSVRELEFSRKELEMTRAELRRSAEAQVLSEKSLRAQADAAQKSARLSTINYLLEHYRQRLDPIRTMIYTAHDERNTNRNDLLARERKLSDILDQEFREVIENHENRQ